MAYAVYNFAITDLNIHIQVQMSLAIYFVVILDLRCFAFTNYLEPNPCKKGRKHLLDLLTNIESVKKKLFEPR